MNMRDTGKVEKIGSRGCNDVDSREVWYLGMQLEQYSM